MKIKKGKIHPSPSSSSSSSDGGDVFNVLKLLPTTILTLASILSLEDKEVLAYMITRSLKTTTTAASAAANPQTPNQDSKKKLVKKSPNSKPTSKNPIFANPTNKIPVSPNLNHKVPIFDCDCFDCYTSYWFRWDSSENRELIHQAIEAFEDHLTSGEQSKKHQKGSKKRDSNNSNNNKTGRRFGEKPVLDFPAGVSEMDGSVFISPEIDGFVGASPVKVGDDYGEEKGEILGVEVVPAAEEMAGELPAVRSPAAGVSNHKGLARKVLPDVLGILNSRLWSLWGPNV
ncbi:hypothetical protein M5689_019838 [Euphorbia peplus]|nr:hypothetical protein M5689_019838 [Euphorbia peplus]